MKRQQNVAMSSSSSIPSNETDSDGAGSNSNGPQNPPSAPPIISPSLFLLGASFPFALGAYGGYRRELKRAAANDIPGSGGGSSGSGIVSRLMEGHELPSGSRGQATTSSASAEAAAAASKRSLDWMQHFSTNSKRPFRIRLRAGGGPKDLAEPRCTFRKNWSCHQPKGCAPEGAAVAMQPANRVMSMGD